VKPCALALTPRFLVKNISICEQSCTYGWRRIAFNQCNLAEGRTSRQAGSRAALKKPAAVAVQGGLDRVTMKPGVK
jgi:hypothetical protein